MNRIALAAVLFALATPVPLRAEDYTNSKLKIRISFPDDFRIRGQETAGKSEWYQGWSDCLLDLSSKDDLIGGMLLQWANYSKDNKEAADWREADLTKQVKSCEQVLQAKLKRPGSAKWLRRDFTIVNDSGEYHKVHVFCATGTDTFELMLWCSEKDWEKCEPRILKVVDGFVQGDDAAGGESGGTDAGAGAATEGPATKAKTPEHMWKGFGEGTSVKYGMVSEAAGTKTEMTMLHELVKQGDKAYSVKTTTEIPAYNMKNAATVEYEIEAAKPGEKDPKTKVEEGDETIKVPAGEFACHWVKTTNDQGWSKIWLSDKVPGRIVKSESDMSGAKATMQLLEMTAK